MSGSEETENKMKIREIATQLFYEKGFTATTVDEIILFSGTSKGTFYHYYKNKAELGFNVFDEAYRQHQIVEDLFPEEDKLVLLTLDIRLFWHAYYNDLNYRRFFYDFCKESLVYETTKIIDTCLESSKKKFNKIEVDLIVVSIQGMRHHISQQVYDKLDQYPCEQVAEFSARQMFRLFEIQSRVIKNVLKRSKELYDQLDIRIERFNYYPALKA